MSMAMAGAVIAPSSATVLFRDESVCSTSCHSSRVSFAPQSRLTLSPLSAICHGQQLRSRPRAKVISLTTSSESRLLCCRSGLSFITSWHGRSYLGEIVGIFEGRYASGSSRRGTAGKVHASLLGVGAPEALVIAVVALVVFGPKGLAEVARTLGKSLKAFQPTIQELQQVSREFKNTLEQEIGLDELRKPMDVPPTYQQPPPPQQQPPNGAPDARAVTADDYMRVTPEQAKALVPEDLRRESEAAAWGRSPPPKIPAENDIKGVVSDEEKPKNES